MMWSKGANFMKKEIRYLYLDSFEHRLAVAAINYFRNQLIQTGKPTVDVDALLLKLLKAPMRKIKY